MFYTYTKSQLDAATIRYTNPLVAHLFGSRVGWIPTRFLPWKLSNDKLQCEPYEWHVDVSKYMCSLEQSKACIVIDLKPKVTSQLSLYELTDIWGACNAGWTPLLMRLWPLFVDEPIADRDKASFTVAADPAKEPVYSMLWTVGTVKDGKPTGKWLPPGPSATNSVLLWPKSLEYFVSEIKKKDPSVLPRF